MDYNKRLSIRIARIERLLDRMMDAITTDDYVEFSAKKNRDKLRRRAMREASPEKKEAVRRAAKRSGVKISDWFAAFGMRDSPLTEDERLEFLIDHDFG